MHKWANRAKLALAKIGPGLAHRSPSAPPNSKPTALGGSY